MHRGREGEAEAARRHGHGAHIHQRAFERRRPARVGLDGDLVLWNGDPFELTSKPIAVVSDGIVYPTRAGR